MFAIGQKVTRKNRGPSVDTCGCAVGTYGKIYTVSGRCSLYGHRIGGPGIYLDGVPPEKCGHHCDCLGPEHFVPIDDTKLEIFREMLVKPPELVEVG